MQTVNGTSLSHVAAGAGQSYNVIGELVTFKVMQAETNGAFTAMELLSQPGGGPPLHTHASSEVFTILEGEFEFTCLKDGAPSVYRAVAGDTVYVPSGEAHAYQAVGDIPGKTFVVLTPGTDLEGFFIEAGVPVSSTQPSPGGPVDLGAMIAIAQKHGMTFVPPAAS